MQHKSIEKEIIEHLEAVSTIKSRTSTDEFIRILAKRHDTSEEVIRKAIADWEAGKKAP